MDDKQVNLDELDLVDAEVDIVDKSEDEVEPPCSFITGLAGTGKTHLVKQRAADDPKWGLICSTTGVSAVNLGTVTLNSVLGYFDTESLEDKFLSGFLRTRLHQLAKLYRNLVIDEISMMDARQLDMIHQAMKQVNEFKDVQNAMGIVAVGDFMQLPAVKAAMAFEADCWPKFEANTERLTKCWRQGEGPFLDALNKLRAGDGAAAYDLLSGIVEFRRDAIPVFEGTTIVATNDLANDHNWLRLKKVSGPARSYVTKRWGKTEPSKVIPDTLALKQGALVMILINDSPAFSYVNGDLGHVLEMREQDVRVKLVRNNNEVVIPFVDRRTEVREAPEGLSDQDIESSKETGCRVGNGVFWDRTKKRWVIGATTYMPLRLGWASTTFKSQGLSLDRVQVDLRHNFMSLPGQVYVACSRARTAQGLVLVGNKDMLIRRCRVEPKVLRWL